MRPRHAVVAALLLVVAGSTAAVAATGTAQSGDPTPGLGTPQADPPDPAVVMRINLTASGDARWTVTSRFNVGNGSRAEAFRAMIADVKNGTPPAGAVGYSAATFRSFADRIQGAVNRSAEMNVKGAEWSGGVHNGTATLSLSFTWTDFARREVVENGPNRVVLGDVFAVERTWFSDVSEDQRLVINPPPGYAVDDYSLAQPFDDGTIYFNGPENLTAMNVSIVYVESAGPSTVTPTPTPGPGTPTPTPGVDGDDSGAGLMLVGGGLFLVAVLVVLVVYVRGEDPFDRGGATAGDGGTTPAGTESTDGGSDAPTPEAPGRAAGAGTARERESESDSGGGTGTESEPADAGTGADAVDEELLSDEERVERLLERNGGRMKQANIVSETGWSNAKVSQLLSSMDDDGRIDKLRIGRENLITLPDEDVGDFE